MKISTMLLAGAAALLFAVPAHGQAELISAQLADVDSVMAGRGFTPTSDAVVGTLPAEQDEEFPLELRAGVSYMIVGVCDGGCTDLDLTLTDAAGRTLVEDTALDDLPVLAVTGVDGEFTVTVSMVTCSTAECHYGVRIFQMAEQ